MRRTRLIWFAFGAGVTSLLFTIASFFLRENDERAAILTIMEPAEDFTDLSASGALRDCGVHEFAVSGVIPDGRQFVSLPLNESNSEALDCVNALISNQSLSIELAYANLNEAASDKSGF